MYGNYGMPYMYQSMAPMMNMQMPINSGMLSRGALNMMPNMQGINSLGAASSLGRNAKLFSGIKNFNFSSLLNGASKTLGVVKEAIPVVKEIGPMMGNMRSMIKVASVFKDETDTSKNVVKKEASTNNTNTSSSNQTTTNKTANSHEPNFFL